jgi:hypothetical protein
MRLRLAGVVTGLAAGAILIVGSPTPATSVAPSCDAWARETVSDTDVTPPSPWTVRFECGGNGDTAGHADYDTRIITLWLEHHHTVAELTWTYVHEVGHAYDQEVFDREVRAGWMEVRRLDGDWFGDFADAPPEEDWAEAFTYCVTGDLNGPRLPGFRPPSVSECGLVQYLTGVPSRL